MIPLILGAIALGSTAFGAIAGAAGLADMDEAKEIGEYAQKQYERAFRKLKVDWKATNELAVEYGQLQFDVKRHTIGRFVAFIERIGQGASQSNVQFLEGLDISVQQLKEYKATFKEAEQFCKGGATAALTGVAAGQGAMGLATSVGMAGTGAAISGLSGAAAWNATLAWLGGGSLAAGGGGMALGTVVLGGITIGPALAVGGFMLAGKGEEALTEARKYEAKVNIEIAKIEAAGDFLRQVERQISELSTLVENLDTRAVLGLDELESRPFERKRDAGKFQQVALLVKALAEIAKTPILDSKGNLNAGTATIKAKYRTI